MKEGGGINLRRGLCAAILACALVSAGSPAWAQGADPAQRAALVGQKLRMVEQLLAAPKGQEAAHSGDPEVRNAIARARELVAEARAGADAAEADRRVNEALRLVTQATRGRPAAPPADAQAQRNAELRAQIDEYRRNIVGTLQARRAEGRSPLLVALDQQLLAADDLVREGRHADAADALERAYRSAVQGLARLREGETVTIELRFDTPADEYAYEQKRFQSHDMLVDVMLAERHPTGSMRNAVEQRRQEARALRDRAAESAARGDHRAAIAQLEDATRMLVRALQAAGVTGLF